MAVLRGTGTRGEMRVETQVETQVETIKQLNEHVRPYREQCILLQ